MWQVSWAHPMFGNLLASCSYDRKVTNVNICTSNTNIKRRVMMMMMMLSVDDDDDGGDDVKC